MVDKIWSEEVVELIIDHRMLYQPATVGEPELEVLARIEQLERELGYRHGPKRWFGLLRRNTLARAIRGSNTIEGFNVTVDDAIAAVDGEEPLDPKTEAWAAVTGYRAAMTLVLQKAEDPHFRYSAEFLNALHFMMIGYDLGLNPGRWRSGPIFIHDGSADEIVYEGPDPDQIPELMAALVDFLNGDDQLSPFLKAAMAHLNLVLIHPYSDGNGRMARCLQTLVLARKTGSTHPIFISIEEYLGRNTQDYYEALGEVSRGSWKPHGDTRGWLRFCLTAHYRQAQTTKQRARYYERLFDRVEREVESLGLPDRATMGIAEAALGYKIRNSTYRKLVDVSTSAASRDLRSFVEAGLLEAKGKKRGRYYIASRELRSLVERIPRPERVGDPFEELESRRQQVLPGLDRRGESEG